MPNRCAICVRGHEVRAAVDTALAEGQTLRAIARRHGVSHHSVEHHRNRCEPLPGVVPPAPPPARSIFDPEKILQAVLSAVAYNLSLTQKHQDRDPKLASVASYRAGMLGLKLLEVAGDEHHRQEMRRRLDELKAEVERRQLPSPANARRDAELRQRAAAWNAKDALRAVGIEVEDGNG